MLSSTHRKAQLSAIAHRVNGKYQKLANELQIHPPPVNFPSPFANLLSPPSVNFPTPSNSFAAPHANFPCAHSLPIPPLDASDAALMSQMQGFVNTLSPSDQALYSEMQVMMQSMNPIEAGVRIMNDPRFATFNQRMQREVGGMSAREFKKVQKQAEKMQHHDFKAMEAQLQMAQERIREETIGWNNGTSEAYQRSQEAYHNLQRRNEQFRPFLENFENLKNEVENLQLEIHQSGISSSSFNSLPKYFRDKIKVVSMHDEEVKKLWKNAYERLHPVSNDSR